MDNEENPSSRRDDTTGPENADLSTGPPGYARRELANTENERLAHFIHLLSDDNEGVRWRAAESLGRLGDPAAVDALIDTLWDEDARVRLKAAWALGEIGDRRAVAPLKRLYRMEREDARDIIKEALDAISRKMSTG